MYLVLERGGADVLGIIVLLLFVALFAWIALAFTSALAGFVSLLARGGARARHRPRRPACRELATRTALLMPTYNEDPARVMAGLQAIHEFAGGDRAARAFRHLHPQRHDRPRCLDRGGGGVPRAARAHRRRRASSTAAAPKNTERKAGNIAEWVRRFGGAYPQMLIARRRQRDGGRQRSCASPRAMERASRRRADPDRCRSSSTARTLFARMQQFAGRVYGPMIAHGHRLVARRRGQLLGPQRHDPHARLRRAGGPAAPARAQAVRRPHPQPRFRRGGADAPRRLGGPHGARRSPAATRRARRR